MRPLSRLVPLAACLSMSGVMGCAYVEYRRTYDVSVSVPEAELEPLSDALDHFFAQRGLVLKEKFRDLFPRNVLVSAFEISRTREDDRRYPQLVVAISDTGLVQLIQSEYYLETKPQPEDLISVAKSDLLKAITATIGGTPHLILDPVGPGGRAP